MWNFEIIQKPGATEARQCVGPYSHCDINVRRLAFGDGSSDRAVVLAVHVENKSSPRTDFPPATKIVDGGIKRPCDLTWLFDFIACKGKFDQSQFLRRFRRRMDVFLQPLFQGEILREK